MNMKFSQKEIDVLEVLSGRTSSKGYNKAFQLVLKIHVEKEELTKDDFFFLGYYIRRMEEIEYRKGELEALQKLKDICKIKYEI